LKSERQFEIVSRFCASRTKNKLTFQKLHPALILAAQASRFTRNASVMEAICTKSAAVDKDYVADQWTERQKIILFCVFTNYYFFSCVKPVYGNVLQIGAWWYRL